MSDVQTLIDALAAELGRPTGVDDQHFRAVAYSSHPDGVDRVRLASILQREAPPAVMDWVQSLGVLEAERFARVPANPELGMAARVCMPIQFNGTPLGYLWLIDEPEPLSSAELEEAGRYVDDLSVALYRTRLVERDERKRERALLLRLLGRRPGDASAAATELSRKGYLVRAARYAGLVLRASGKDRAGSPEAVRVRLVDAAERIRRRVAPGHLLLMVDGDEVLVILACASSEEVGRRARALAEAAESGLNEEPGWLALLGVGDEQSTLSGLSTAVEQARAALRTAEAVGLAGPLVEWSSLGAYRTLMTLLGDRDPRDLLPEPFQRLLVSRDAASLVETLECYLDSGGDARAAAQSLYVHRSSLYGRLHRIEEVAGVDLHSGEDRLELHIALRLWRLAEGEPD